MSKFLYVHFKELIDEEANRVNSFLAGRTDSHMSEVARTYSIKSSQSNNPRALSIKDVTVSTPQLLGSVAGDVSLITPP